MPSREQLDLIKRATVALALMPENPPSDPRETPFTIVASGFCIDPAGIVVTCEHVVTAFFQQDIRQVIAEVPEEDKTNEMWPLRGVEMMRPYVLFYATDLSDENLMVFPVPVVFGTVSVAYDVGLVRLADHGAFSDGYPFLEVEDYAHVYEGMDVATCGFPLGNELHDQLGTKTSSFTRGILSSIAPAPGVSPEMVDGFQLDLTATYGNSGGPVFTWDSGRVIGFVQSGPLQASGEPLPGIVRAEPIYRPMLDGTFERFRNQDVSVEDLQRLSDEGR